MTMTTGMRVTQYLFFCVLYHSSFTQPFILFYHAYSKTSAHTNKSVLTTVPEQFPIIFPTHKLNYICPVVILNVINVHCYKHVILCIKYFLSIMNQNSIFFMVLAK